MNKSLLDVIENHLNTRKFYNIVFIGDSLTSCEWIHPNWREIVEYVVKSELEKKMSDWRLPVWKLKTFNAGFNGGDSKDVIDLLQEGILLHKPDMAFIMLGTNDADFNTTTPEKFKENIAEICEKLESINCKNIVLMTSPKTLDEEANKGYLNYFSKIQELANANNLLFLDLFKKFENLDLSKIYTFVSPRDEIDGTKAGDLDKVHPNMLGNTFISKFILEDLFKINFNPELYLRMLLNGQKFPQY